MTYSDESDESLIGRFARGEAEAFEALYRRHETRTWRYLVRNVGNQATADELMQEVWFAVAKGAARYEPLLRAPLAGASGRRARARSHRRAGGRDADRGGCRGQGRG